MLFGALGAAALHSIRTYEPRKLHPLGMRLGQALVGTTIGSLLEPSTARWLSAYWLPIAVVTLVTLLTSVLLGQLLRVHEGVSSTTGAFSLIAGGASGVGAVAQELGADEQTVAVVQYLRILVVLLTLPAALAVLPSPSLAPGLNLPEAAGGVGAGPGVLFTVVCVAVGHLASRYGRLPTGSLLGPLLVAAVLSASNAFGDVDVPSVLENFGYALIGVQIGLRFTRAGVARIARILPLALLLIAVLIGVCAGMGMFLASVTGASQRDAYLATTPGGLYAVLAVAADSGDDVTFILGVQVVRIFVMIIAAPLLGRFLRSSTA